MDGFKKERRWVVLVTDGRFMLLGRDADPSDERIEDLEGSLSERGLAGWLLIMEGEPTDGTKPRLMQVRSLAEPKTSFDSAVDAFVKNYASGPSGFSH
ncbi:hypothetical protein [Sabulicella glaciei]|uniref:Uncharacterized protein n=1 Tax=Sabulicella glaciei TaxID=2984948 RepID=A0ABT3NZE9_9PROT|nr:hypothetical protein [Roseococcus sp. MDT2-1-1]MCW8087543.1 hypothetical protein [Roseococcus sp. MDT2-1-1]